MAGTENERFRSFAERYVVERASTLEPGKEREQAFTVILDARCIYEQIALQGATVQEAFTRRDLDEANQSAGVQATPHVVTKDGGLVKGSATLQGLVNAFNQFRRRGEQPPAALETALKRQLENENGTMWMAKTP